MIEVPYFVNDYIKREIMIHNKVIVDIDEYTPDSSQIIKKYGLTFGIDQCFNGLNGKKITIQTYISNILKYSRKNIKIYLNKRLLSDIQPIMLSAPLQTPPTINLETI